MSAALDLKRDRHPDEFVDIPEIPEIENRLLQGILSCRTQEAVEASITYARFLSTVGITPENYPVFLRMLEIENHWVIDALIGERDPFLLLSSVQPNRYIVSRALSMMMRWHKGGIYHKNLSMILGVLQSVYSSARDGYRIYQLRIADLNAVGKHLNKEKGQDDPLNRAILDVLDRIADLEDSHDSAMEEIAIHASAIRNAFFDDTKKMESVIPPVLLVSGREHRETAPRDERGISAREQREREERPLSARKGAPSPNPVRPPESARPHDPAGAGAGQGTDDSRKSGKS